MVIAATNRLQDIDDAGRRPGRFDWELRFPRPNREDRESILEKAGRRLSIDGTLPHATIADRTELWSAAELAAIWSEAALFAASEGRSMITSPDYVGGFERVSEQRRRADGSQSTGGSA